MRKLIFKTHWSLARDMVRVKVHVPKSKSNRPYISLPNFHLQVVNVRNHWRESRLLSSVRFDHITQKIFKVIKISSNYKGKSSKKRIFYGQADRMGWSTLPLFGQLFVNSFGMWRKQVFLVQKTVLALFRGSNFHICVRSGLGGLTPSPPYGQPAHFWRLPQDDPQNCIKSALQRILLQQLQFIFQEGVDSGKFELWLLGLGIQRGLSLLPW